MSHEVRITGFSDRDDADAFVDLLIVHGIKEDKIDVVGRRPVQDRLKTIASDIREEDSLGELTLAGEFGYHTFFNPNRTEFGIGTETAKVMAFQRTTEELWLDGDIVADTHGEVTPETVAAEAEIQLEEFIGQFHFFESYAQHLEEILQQSQEQFGPWGEF